MSEPVESLKIDHGLFRLVMGLMRSEMNVRTLDFQPNDNRGLYAKISPIADQLTVRLRCDQAIAPAVIANHHWEIETITFARDVIMRYPACNVIDVGANMGLFSRQLLGWTNGIVELFAYEPEPENFACLKHNLAPFRGCVLEMVGLAAQDGTSILHINSKNCGNSSLIPHKKGSPERYAAINIEIRNIALESRRWIAAGLPIFYKSDTQGYDEYLISLLPDDVCEKIIGGFFEIEQANRPDFDMARFRKFLDLFPNKQSLDFKGDHVSMTTDDIIAMMDQPGIRGANIGFCR